MTNTNLFSTASETITWLRKIAVPMQNFEGESLPDTGIASVTVPKRVVDTLLAGVSGTVERSTGKQSVYNFTFDKLAYTLQVNFGWSDMKRITFTWDHRTEEPTPEPEVKKSPFKQVEGKTITDQLMDALFAEDEPETVAVTAEGETELFKFYYRDLSERMTMEIAPWEAINNYRMMDGKWQVKKQIGDRWIIIAESKNWHFESVSEKMQRQNNSRPKLSSRLVNGLLVETETERDVIRTRIYFQSTKDPVFSPHIKIYNGTHISLEGNVTHENYYGFVQASAMAGTLLKMVEANRQ